MPADKSPRAPSSSLPDALEKVLKIYTKERKNAVPLEVAAQDMGYRNANSGPAMQALATLRYFGLLERPKAGQLAVSRDVEQYQFAPDESLKSQLRQKWMRTPTAFAAILQQFSEHEPSDAGLRYALIDQGFNPTTAASFVDVFKASAAFAEIYTSTAQSRPAGDVAESSRSDLAELSVSSAQNAANQDRKDQAYSTIPVQPPRPAQAQSKDVTNALSNLLGEDDRIPVRLSHGRKAWLIVPSPFFEQDKVRLIKQIELLLTDEPQD